MTEAVDLTLDEPAEASCDDPRSIRRKRRLRVIDLSCSERPLDDSSSAPLVIDITSLATAAETPRAMIPSPRSEPSCAEVVHIETEAKVSSIDAASSSTTMPSQAPSLTSLIEEKSLQSLEIDLTAAAHCRICYDQVSENESCSCPRHHALCTGCFEGFICSANAPGSINYVDGSGRLLCFICQVAYDPRAFTGASKQRLYDLLQELRISKVKEKELKIELEKQEARLRSEFEQTLAKSGEEREAHLLIRKIRNEILNLRCPACGAVFVDFEGCFALRCAVSTCRRAFCAWCLVDCGKNAHKHLAVCPEGNGSFWGDLTAFNAHHKKRRAARIKALLKEESKMIQRKVLDALKIELKDLGIQTSKLL